MTDALETPALTMLRKDFVSGIASGQLKAKLRRPVARRRPSSAPGERNAAGAAACHVGEYGCIVQEKHDGQISTPTPWCSPSWRRACRSAREWTYVVPATLAAWERIASAAGRGLCGSPSRWFGAMAFVCLRAERRNCMWPLSFSCAIGWLRYDSACSISAAQSRGDPHFAPMIDRPHDPPGRPRAAGPLDAGPCVSFGNPVLPAGGRAGRRSDGGRQNDAARTPLAPF